MRLASCFPTIHILRLHSDVNGMTVAAIDVESNSACCLGSDLVAFLQEQSRAGVKENRRVVVSLEDGSRMVSRNLLLNAVLDGLRLPLVRYDAENCPCLEDLAN